MPNDFPKNESSAGSSANDPQNLWKNQITEVFQMSADQLRHKALQRQTLSRIEAVNSIIGGLILMVVFGWNVARVHEVIPRAGWGVLSLWCAYLAYQAYHWIWPGKLPADAALSTTLQSFKRELEKRRDYARNIWRRAGLSFLCLGLAMIIVPSLIESHDVRRTLAQWGPVLVLFVVWLALFLFLRSRRRQKLQREIEELDRFGREGRS
jgi:hypothetical protein